MSGISEKKDAIITIKNGWPVRVFLMSTLRCALVLFRTSYRIQAAFGNLFGNLYFFVRLLFKTFHGKLLVDLKVPLFTPDIAKTRELSGRCMQLGPFTGRATIDHLTASTIVAGHLSVFSHLHITFCAPDGSWGRFATARLCVVAIFAWLARIIHGKYILLNFLKVNRHLWWGILTPHPSCSQTAPFGIPAAWQALIRRWWSVWRRYRIIFWRRIIVILWWRSRDTIPAIHNRWLYLISIGTHALHIYIVVMVLCFLRRKIIIVFT